MKAVLKNGVIQPQEPLPADWPEGTELEVERAESSLNGDSLDQWYAELEAACSQLDPRDDKLLKNAIADVRREEKERARKEAGLKG